MSQSAIPSRSAVMARAQEGSGAILRKGGAMLVSPQWPLFECQSLALIGQDESRYNLVPLRSAKFNSDRDIPFGGAG